MLQLESVNTHYGSSHILQGVNMQVNEGEVVCLLGRNGAGKTTTVSSIVGFAPPSSGNITFKGVDITRMPVERRARAGIALVPQGRRVFPMLTVRENLEVGKRPLPGGWDLERVYAMFPRLKERMGNLGSNLSGGEQQMVAIGRALMANPSLILMDEPSEGLAPLIIEEMYRHIEQIARDGTAILLVEHSLDQAIRMASRIYIMNKGSIMFETNDPNELTQETRHRLLGVGHKE
ncbi:ABC transporter ATP-binding protein [Lacisediminimonas profundi]|uniref:ABC transporter ATP-binding protein n=1 Tax=Lacisediminimonas profundi TaxID=2603856 RepID=UPI00124B9D9D|nr:ABC transporter ATP-binding protein [Lacisediminimonas profundi]